jgi:hypothetical protein
VEQLELTQAWTDHIAACIHRSSPVWARASRRLYITAFSTLSASKRALVYRSMFVIVNACSDAARSGKG